MVTREEAPVTAAVVGMVVTACAVVAGAAAAVPGRLSLGQGRHPHVWTYFWVIWPLSIGLAVAGIVLAAKPHRRRPAAVAAVVLGAQVCAHGIVAVRDWFNTAGALGGMRQTDLALVTGFAAVVAVCAAVACAVSAAVVWREPAGGWRGLRPRRPGYAAAALVVVLGLPVVPLVAFQFPSMTQAVQVALLYSLPWGAGIAVAGWLGRPGRIAALSTVGLSMVLVVAEYAVRTLTRTW